jgi:hypothetical protein
MQSHTVSLTYKLTTHLKYNTSDHNPELQQQVVSCWIECRQVDKSQVVIQAVEESRNKVQHHNCQKGKYCHKMLFIHNEKYCLNENSDPIPSRQLGLRRHAECFRNFHLCMRRECEQWNTLNTQIKMPLLCSATHYGGYI